MARLFTIPLIFLALALSQTGTSGDGSIQGTVIDLNGKPISDATVYAVPDKNGYLQIHTRSDQLGRFNLKNVPAGGAWVSAFKDSEGYPYNFFSFYAMPGDHLPDVKVRANETTTGVVVQLGQKAAYLDIVVLDQEGNLLRGASLDFHRPDQGDQGKFGAGIKGEQRFPVPPVPFRMSAELDGYEVWHYGSKDWQGKPGLISLKSGESLSLTIRLKRKAR